jgi:hypothetical protein
VDVATTQVTFFKTYYWTSFQPAKVKCTVNYAMDPREQDRDLTFAVHSTEGLPYWKVRRKLHLCVLPANFSAVGTWGATVTEQGVNLETKGGEKNEKHITSNQPASVFDVVLGRIDRQWRGGNP